MQQQLNENRCYSDLLLSLCIIIYYNLSIFSSNYSIIIIVEEAVDKLI